METEAEPPLVDNDPTAPRLWQLWRPFVGIHRWYFAPGCPPPLRNLNGWTAIAQTSVLCAGIGMVAGMLAVVVIVVMSLFPPYGSTGMIFLLGLAYGIVVIYPLSRWINRSIFWSLAGVVMCILCYAALLPANGGWSGFLRSQSARPTTPFLRFLGHLFVFAPSMMALGLFMRGRQRRITWLLPCVFLSVVAFAVSMELQAILRMSLPAVFRANVWISLCIGAQPVLLSWMLLTIALGMRLWPSMRDADLPPRQLARSLTSS